MSHTIIKRAALFVTFVLIWALLAAGLVLFLAAPQINKLLHGVK